LRYRARSQTAPTGCRQLGQLISKLTSGSWQHLHVGMYM